ncbi:MAG: hypothetical protein V8R80_09155 [Eubacterium sp.]
MGCGERKENRSTLVGKSMLAGMEDSNTFHEKREACIRQKYDADVIPQLDGGADIGPYVRKPSSSWTDPLPGDTEKISDKAAERDT